MKISWLLQSVQELDESNHHTRQDKQIWPVFIQFTSTTDDTWPERKRGALCGEFGSIIHFNVTPKNAFINVWSRLCKQLSRLTWCWIKLFINSLIFPFPWFSLFTTNIIRSCWQQARLHLAAQFSATFEKWQTDETAGTDVRSEEQAFLRVSDHLTRVWGLVLSSWVDDPAGVLCRPAGVRGPAHGTKHPRELLS